MGRRGQAVTRSGSAAKAGAGNRSTPGDAAEDAGRATAARAVDAADGGAGALGGGGHRGGDQVRGASVIAIPSVISLLGLGLGFAGLLQHSALLLVLSLACDVADGKTARRLRCTTEAGAILDRTIDATLAGAISWACWPPLIALPIAWTQLTNNRYSGRALITIAACISW